MPNITASILHPTRANAKQAFEKIKKWKTLNNSNNLKIEYLIGIDETEKDEYCSYLNRLEANDDNFKIKPIFFNKKTIELKQILNKTLPEKKELDAYSTAISKANFLADKSSGDWLLFSADDYGPIAEWSQIFYDIVENERPREDSIVFGRGIEIKKDLVSHPIMSRKYYEDEGFFFFPEYIHNMADNDLFYRSIFLKQLRIMPLGLSFLLSHETMEMNGSVEDIAELFRNNECMLIARSIHMQEYGLKVFNQRINYFGVPENVSFNFKTNEAMGKLVDELIQEKLEGPSKPPKKEKTLTDDSKVSLENIIF